MSREEKPNSKLLHPDSFFMLDEKHKIFSLQEMLLNETGMEGLNKLFGARPLNEDCSKIELIYKNELVEHILTLVVQAQANKEDKDQIKLEAEKFFRTNPALLLEKGTVMDYSGRTHEKRTAFQLALGAEDSGMAQMMASILDEYFPGERYQQAQEQFPEDEEKKETERQIRDSDALRAMIQTIEEASEKECEAALKVPEDETLNDKVIQALRTFREYLRPKETITTGKHFNMQLLIEAFDLYDQKFDLFGDIKIKLFWRKVIGYIECFLPAGYAQFILDSHNIAELGKPLKRSLTLYNFVTDEKIFYFPLVTVDSKDGMGFTFAIFGNGGRDKAGRFARWGRFLVGGMSATYLLKNYVTQQQQLCRNLYNPAKNQSILALTA